MTSTTSQACLVCGVETKNVCSTCRKAGIDLYFCGDAHQRLVWPQHKRACGERGNPFRWPRLTRQEVADALDILVKEVDEHQSDAESLRVKLIVEAGLRPEEAEGLIKHLGKSDPIPGLDETKRQACLCAVHNERHRRSGGIPDPLNETMWFGQLAFSCEPAQRGWQSELIHRQLVAQSLLCLVRQEERDGAPHSAVWEYARHALAGAHDWVMQTRDKMSRTEWTSVQIADYWVTDSAEPIYAGSAGEAKAGGENEVA